MVVIPSEAWKVSNEVFVDQDYDKPGQTNKPEYGVNISKNYGILDIFNFKESIKAFLLVRTESDRGLMPFGDQNCPHEPVCETNLYQGGRHPALRGDFPHSISG